MTEKIEKGKKIPDSAHFILRKGVIIVGGFTLGLCWMQFLHEFIASRSVIYPNWWYMLGLCMCLVLTALLLLCYFIDRSLCRLISIFLLLSVIGVLMPGYA